jgi:hypothetical protein
MRYIRTLFWLILPSNGINGTPVVFYSNVRISTVPYIQGLFELKLLFHFLRDTGFSSMFPFIVSHQKHVEASIFFTYGLYRVYRGECARLRENVP